MSHDGTLATYETAATRYLGLASPTVMPAVVDLLDHPRHRREP